MSVLETCGVHRGYILLEVLKLEEIKGLSPSKHCFSTGCPFCFLLQYFGKVEDLQGSLHRREYWDDE